MVSNRRDADADVPTGLSAVLVVRVSDGHDADTVVAACQSALRKTDAVVEQSAGDTIAVLLRHVRRGEEDARIVADRVRRACATAGTPTGLGLAVASDPDEPLDQVLHRARNDIGVP